MKQATAADPLCSGELYRAIYEECIAGFASVDTEGSIKAYNPTFREMVGFTDGELQKMTYRDLTPEKWHAMEEKVIREQITTGKRSQVYEKEYRRKDGVVFPVELHTFLLRDGNGRPSGLWAIVRDITERKFTEEALRESEERYRTLLDNIEEGYHEVDLAGSLTLFNETFSKILGYGPEELTGMHYSRYTDKKNRKKVYPAYNAVFRTGKPLKNFEWEVIRKNGERRTIEVSVSLKKDTAGNPVGFRGIVRDVTERKRAEEEKKALEAQLYQAQKMKAVGTLAGGIAHDFNNILASIIGYTEMTLRRELPGESRARANLEQVLKAGNRAKDLVDRILDFSRRREQSRRPVALSSTVEEAFKLLRASLPSTIELRTESSAKNDVILADPVQIHQVVMNLCTNAAQAMRKKGGLLSVRISHERIDSPGAALPDLKAGCYLKLSVSDTGHGIAPEILERIYDPFFTTKGLGGGTGLGLSVVYGIVKGCNGAITVKSKPGEGATFDLYFPVIAEGAGETSMRRGIHSDLPRGTEKILYVDDEEAIVNVGKEMLAHLGYRVVACTGSGEALAAFRKEPHRIDLVITDYTMPAMTGTELAAKILAIRADVPIILATGYSPAITPEKAKALGIRELLMKPVFICNLARTIREVLDQ